MLHTIRNETASYDFISSLFSYYDNILKMVESKYVN